MSNTVRVKQKPSKCPKCGSQKIAKILYGMPAYSTKLRKDMDEGKIVLGGCCIGMDDPVWKCVDCKLDIYRQ